MDHIFDAEFYNKFNGPQSRDALEAIEQILNDNNKTYTSESIIVDLGCGSGNVTSLLSNNVPHKKILAVDVDSEMIKYAQANYPSKSIEYLLQDISAPWDTIQKEVKDLEGKVDLVWCNSVIHWVKDKIETAKTIARLLKPGGRCYLGIFVIRDITEFADKGEEYKRYMRIESHEEQYKSWKHIFENCGLSNVDVYMLNKLWIWDSDEKQTFHFNGIQKFFVKTLANERFNEASDEEKQDILQRIKNISIEAAKIPYVNFQKLNVEPTSTEKRIFNYERIKVFGIK